MGGPSKSLPLERLRPLALLSTIFSTIPAPSHRHPILSELSEAILYNEFYLFLSGSSGPCKKQHRHEKRDCRYISPSILFSTALAYSPGAAQWHNNIAQKNFEDRPLK